MTPPCGIYSTSNSDFNELAFGETKADINRETGEKSGETKGVRSPMGEGEEEEEEEGVEGREGERPRPVTDGQLLPTINTI